MSDVSEEKFSEKIKSHRDLIAWQKAMSLTVEVYQITKAFPKEDLFGLTSQIRRASASIAANIAEGQGRRLGGEFKQFLGNARGSLLELDTHIELAFRVGYITKQQYNNIQEKIKSRTNLKWTDALN